MTIFSVLFLSLIFVSSCAAIAENQVRILFNNGIAAAGMSCNSADMQWVTFSLPYGRRNLRQGNRTVNEQQSVGVEDSSGSGRKLPLAFYSASCKTSCTGFATGTCVAPACKAYRRELEEDENDRGLQYSDMWCTMAKNYVDNTLNMIVMVGGFVSSPCMKLLKAPRRIECLSVVC
jgi:hypothetical protein